MTGSPTARAVGVAGMRRLFAGCLLVVAACSGAASDARVQPSSTAFATTSATAAPTSSTAPAPPATTTTTTIPLVVEPDASIFTPAQSRLFDSRMTGALLGGERRDLPLAAPGGATAVVATITMLDTSAPAGLTVWGDGAPPPFGTVYVAGAGDAVAKTVLVRLGDPATITLLATTDANVIVDLAGWLVRSSSATRAGRLVTTVPTRVADGVALTADVPLSVAVATAPGDAVALLAVTLTDAAPPGYAVVWPAGLPRPPVSQLQLPALGWTATNLVPVAVGAQRRIEIVASSPTIVTVDLIGWFTGASAGLSVDGLIVPVTADRLVSQQTIEPPFRSDAALGTAGLPRASASAVWLDVHANTAADSGNIAVYPARTVRSASSLLPVQGAGTTSTSPVLARVGAGDALSVAADQSVDVALSLRAYVVGRPLPADPVVPEVPADQFGTARRENIDTIIEALLADTNSAGASVAIAKDGRIVYARAYGSRDAMTGSPMRIDSRLRYASISKVFTATALLQLVHAGKVGLDDTALQLLAGKIALPVDHDPRIDTITVRHLLDHTAGWRTSPDPFFNEEPGMAEAFGPTGPSSCRAGAQWFMALPLSADPGAGFGYRNINYCLAGLIVEALTARPLAEVLTDSVLVPRGIAGVAVGHSQRFGTNDVVHKTPGANERGGGLYMEALGGAGNLIGSTVDLVRFLDGLDPRKPGVQLLPPDLQRQMTTAQPNTGGWGLGLDILDADRWGHTGGLHGARGMVLHERNGVTWALIVNGSFPNHQPLFEATMRRVIGTIRDWPTWDYGTELP